MYPITKLYWHNIFTSFEDVKVYNSSGIEILKFNSEFLSNIIIRKIPAHYSGGQYKIVAQNRVTLEEFEYVIETTIIKYLAKNPIRIVRFSKSDSEEILVYIEQTKEGYAVFYQNETQDIEAMAFQTDLDSALEIMNRIVKPFINQFKIKFMDAKTGLWIRDIKRKNNED